MLFSGVGLLDKKNDIIAYLHKCISLINAQWPINLFSTIGSVEKNYCNVSRSYDSAKELQEYSLIYEPNSVLNFTDIQKSESGNDAIVRFNYDKLYEHLVNQRKDHAVNMIEEYYSHVLSMEGITPKIVQNISVEILYNLSGLYKKVVRSYDMPHDLGILFSDIMKFKTHHELVDWISLIVNKMLDCLVACEEKQNPLIKHIIQHVNMHYQEPLSLKTISASQNVNTSYLGQLFKNETGELFTNYLNGVRIQKAQEMLTKTNMKVYDIAYKTGYVNQSLFFRTFKKYTGVSPEEYRERNIRA
jgi:two-component system response regulator YesN